MSVLRIAVENICIFFLRIQIRWNRFRRREGEQTTHTASNERRLEPKEAEVVETVEAVLARADSASDFLLQVDDGSECI